MAVELPTRAPIKAGRLAITDADGQRYSLQGPAPGPEVAIRISDPRLLRRLLLVPDLILGEGYMDGTITVEAGSLYDVIDFCAINLMPLASEPKAKAGNVPGHQHNVVGVAKANVAHHYDLDRRLFELFLDEDLQYSCAYFSTGRETLEQAQETKKRRAAAKLLLEPGMRVLDIGSGFGGLALHLARRHRVEVVGVTLSEEQQQVASARARAAGLAGQVTFKLLDYREEQGRYDRIVSIGMFEHVGAAHYDEFFAKLRELMTGDGVAMLHSIGRMGPPGLSLPWITKYIFPGGYTPSLSETIAAVERSGLWITDVEILRLHYAHTLAAWHERFAANRERAKALYDERFCRMWEFYLKISEVAFRRLNWMVFQLQIAATKEAVPIERGYMMGTG